MKNYYIVSIISVFFISMFFCVTEVSANQSIDSNNYSINFLTNENSDEVCTSLLGGNLKSDLQSVMDIIRIVGPLLVIFLTSAEFIVAIAGKDDDAIKKCTNKLVTRLILVAILFLLPTLLNLFLEFLDQKYTTCIK
ncbi:MAG: hypothetical protein PHF21_02210 [Bacilli bacterium]|nr:hypothetical protein [Bacilli bacterium]